MKLNEKKLKDLLRHPVTVAVFDEIDSTNNEAKRRTAQDNACGLYVASAQTAGRGRRGRSFYSPPDTGLYMTAALPIHGSGESIPRVTCAAAVAVSEAIEALCGVDCRIKWVNDLYVNSRKVCGILCELLLDGQNRPQSVIVGVGVNLTTADFPEEIGDRAGSIGAIDRERLCARITDNLIDEYRLIGERRFLPEYRRRSLALGQTVRYLDGNTVHTARAVDIDENGGLVVEENGSTRTLSSGEISIIID